MRIAVADVAIVAIAVILTFTAGPRTRHGWAIWMAASALGLLTAATGAIYGGELRRVNPLRSRRPIDRSGLPPRDDAETGPDAEIEDRPPRLRALLPALVAVLIGLALAAIVGGFP
jgi:hypothetical protein